MSAAPQSGLVSRTSTWQAKVIVATTVVVSGCVLYGFSVASDPATYQPRPAVRPAALPCEDDYRRVANSAHNERVFELRQLLADRGFLVNGTDQVSAHPLAVLRGTYGLVSPPDEPHGLEWRLMATRSATCQPSCYLRIENPCTPFSPHLAEILTCEWRKADRCLPGVLVDRGSSLVSQLITVWQDDRQEVDGGRELSANVVERRWSNHKRLRKYELRLRDTAGEYQIEAQLCDRRRPDADSCEVALVFKWLGDVHARLAQSE